MSKFTSKDLMYAMGLQKGDVIENERSEERRVGQECIYGWSPDH